MLCFGSRSSHFLVFIGWSRYSRTTHSSPYRKKYFMESSSEEGMQNIVLQPPEGNWRTQQGKVRGIRFTIWQFMACLHSKCCYDYGHVELARNISCEGEGRLTMLFIIDLIVLDIPYVTWTYKIITYVEICEIWVVNSSPTRFCSHDPPPRVCKKTIEILVLLDLALRLVKRHH